MHRRAFTLIEMVIAITVAAALTGIAVSLLIVLLRAEQSGRSHFQRNASIQRLADQWRRDLHAAVGEVAVNHEDRPGCRLTLAGDRIVRYTIGDDGISREEHAGPKTSRRESYALPNDSTASIEIDNATKPAIVSLMIEPKDESLRSSREIRIDALQSRDLRFSNQRKEDEP